MTKRKETKQLWKNDFKMKELRLYKTLNDKDIETIEQFQKRLPVLLEENETVINTRDLYVQLGVAKDYNTWIKQQFEDLDYEENVDYKAEWTKEGYPFEELAKYSSQKMRGLGYSQDFYTTTEIAKEIAMICGTKGGRTSKELKENSRIARRYFIAIEKAFKERTVWNKNRQASVDTFFDLKKVIMKDLHSNNELGKYLPSWFSIVDNNTGRKNTLAYEMYLIDKVIIGMSSSEYRKLKNLDSKAVIRNTFSKQQLADFEMLQSKSAEYIIVQGIWDTNERVKLLEKFYDYEKSKRVNNVA